MDAPAVRSACAGGEPFMATVRDDLKNELATQGNLWRQGLEKADTPAAVDAWQQDRLVSFPGGGAWQVPTDPDWSEDPYRNLSWAAGYQSLAWLVTLARGYRAGDAAMGDELRHYLLSWIAANPVHQPQSVRSWYNGAVHRRTNAIIAAWDVLLVVLDDDELAQVMIALHHHGAQLGSYLGRERFHGHNHNLFHALALLNLANNVPVLAQASAWREQALQRMHALLGEMVNPRDGVSTEQAATYHYLAMRLFVQAQLYLVSNGRAFTQANLALLTEMTRFGALLPDPAGLIPAIGDTGFGGTDATARDLLGQFDKLGLATPEAQFVLSRGKNGRRPADASFFLGEGLAIFRPSFGEVGDWDDDLHVVADMGPSSRVHGHDDAMNVVMTAHGEQLLVDSGGPYQYGVDERRAFTDVRAHNTVVVDGRGYSAGDAVIESTLDTLDYSLITGAHEKSPGVQHRRTVMVVKPSLVLVVDDLQATDGREHTFNLLYHLAPDSDVVAAGLAAQVVTGSAAMGLTVAAGQDLSVAVRRGETDPLVGWVTTALGKKESAPVLDFSQRSDSTWYVTAIVPSQVSEASQVQLIAERTVQGFRVDVTAGGREWTVMLPNDGEPTVAP